MCPKDMTLDHDGKNCGFSEILDDDDFDIRHDYNAPKSEPEPSSGELERFCVYKADDFILNPFFRISRTKK
jgi:hypothetical protein